MNQFKIITMFLAFSTSVSMLSLAHATTSTYTPPVSTIAEEKFIPMHGLYAGIGMGFLSLNDEATSSSSFANGSGVKKEDETLTANAGETGFNSYLLGGYSWTFANRIFLAGEIFGNLTHVSSPINFNHADSDISTTNNSSLTLESVYGFRVLPGYQVANNIIIYGIAGYARAATSSNDTYTLNKSDNLKTVSSNDSVNFNGYQLGLGSMLRVTEHISLRGDLIYTGYDEQTLAQASEVANNGSVVQSSVTGNPSTWEGDIGIVYSF